MPEFETPGRTLSALLGPCPGVLFTDSFRTLPGFWARRAQETLCGVGPITPESFVKFIFGYGSESWRGFLVNFQWSPFPRKKKHEKLSKTQTPVLPFLGFLDFLGYYLTRNFLGYFGVLSSFSKEFVGSAEKENPW